MGAFIAGFLNDEKTVFSKEAAFARSTAFEKTALAFRRQALEVLGKRGGAASQNIINARVGWDDDFMKDRAICLFVGIEIYANDA
ncbi:hypothetical protein G7048_10905 [Diaphorobacter sp. HDW4B]|uniref:hypothetical protein n=1 Tax=Diaphorobacter sp. HDW4B TaxID=2714925 RepID=UPI0014076E3F|nr:hypothetical protein [Diaphorobacter sp. HDW4B]QIL70826.1 hypothetical protein G7048_10905 [Diaphorobacter sp. HDW4B]